MECGHDDGGRDKDDVEDVESVVVLVSDRS
jgi:hypothetical protein